MGTCILEAWSGLPHLSWCGAFQPLPFLLDQRREGSIPSFFWGKQWCLWQLLLAWCWSSQASSLSETVGKKVKQRTSNAAKSTEQVSTGVSSRFCFRWVCLLQQPPAPACPSVRLLPQMLLQCRWKMSLISPRKKSVWGRDEVHEKTKKKKKKTPKIVVLKIMYVWLWNLKDLDYWEVTDVTLYIVIWYFLNHWIFRNKNEAWGGGGNP